MTQLSAPKAEGDGSGPRRRWRTGPRGLSGKLLVLTAFVILATEVLVFVPSVANYRLTWLNRHFTTGEAASLALERLPEDAVPDDVRLRLLDLTETEMLVVRSRGASRVLAARKMPAEIARHVALAPPGRINALASIADAFDTLLFGGRDRVIRVYGPMRQRSGQLELVMRERPLRMAMLSYAGNVALISLAISLVTGLLVFLALRALLIRPLQRMSRAMVRFADDPEDARARIAPTGRDDEIGVAEEQLAEMQARVASQVSERRRLADLGLAVSKINHDLRNILASASLFSDRLATLSDPTVQRLAPRLVRAIDRAADYTRAVLAYGKTGETVPQRRVLRLRRLIDEVAETLALDAPGPDDDARTTLRNEVPERFTLTADPEQLFRVLLNLTRNAVQALQENPGDPTLVRRVTIEAKVEGEETLIHVTDTGPGLPSEVRRTLFSAFGASARSGGTGLGLAIAAELVTAHGGRLTHDEAYDAGTRFTIALPRVCDEEASDAAGSDAAARPAGGREVAHADAPPLAGGYEDRAP